MVKCIECGKQFNRRPAHIKKRIYCSHLCYRLNATICRTEEQKLARIKKMNAANRHRRDTDPEYKAHIKKMLHDNYMRNMKDPAYVQKKKEYNRKWMAKQRLIKSKKV